MEENYILVAAIDFGTAFSGYAFSFRDEFKKNPLLIHGNTEWKSGTEHLCTSKTPSVILFDPNGKFASFGYEAELQYATLSEDEDETGDYKRWFFFKHFKMALYQEMKKVFGPSHKRAKNITRRLKITSENGNTMSALTVFSEAIKFMAEHVKQTIQLQVSFRGKSRLDDIRWVLTVPAIWSEHAKQFMREAAIMAGIPDKQLLLALEPEAAAVYCKEIQATMKTTSEGTHLGAFSVGEKFMVLDCGGGTVDVTVHEVLSNGTLGELCAPSGGPWGGTYVDKEFILFIIQLFGEIWWKNFQSEYPQDVLELKRQFEVKKRNFKIQQSTNKVVFTGINNMLEYFTKHCNTTLEERIACSMDFKDNVDIFKNRLRLSKTLMQSFFKSSVDSIIAHLEGLFSSPEIHCVDSILMVGGYSEADALQSQIKNHFQTKDITVPEDGGLVVLKGAVIFGHKPVVVRFRKSKFTYGISVSVPFDERKHLPKYRHVKDGRSMCTDVFYVMVCKDQTLEMGKSFFEKVFNPSGSYSVKEEIEIYYSTEYKPLYTTPTDSCKKLGVITYPMPMSNKEKKEIKVQIHFDFTEIKVTVTEVGSGVPKSATFDCLT